MYKRILVPLDGSELAEQVLPYARTLGRALGTSVELLRSVEPVSWSWRTQRLASTWMEWQALFWTKRRNTLSKQGHSSEKRALR